MTDFIRFKDGILELQQLLSSEGFCLSKSLLASFMEDEEGMEYGLIVTSDNGILEYSRYVYSDSAKPTSLNLEEITNNTKKIKEYPQIPIALMMIDKKLL